MNASRHRRPEIWYNAAMKTTATFIRLTRPDGAPIWFNRNCIVTVESRKGSGAIVVPMGDDLDYEVVEQPAAIVEALGGDMMPPLPSPSKRKSSARKSDGPAEKTGADEKDAPDFRIDGGLIVSAAETVETEAPAPASAADSPPQKGKGREKKSGRATTSKTVKAKAKASTKAKALPRIPLDEEQLIRLQKMSPGSLRKLVNTLMTQFKVAETQPAIDALTAREVISVSDQGHVEWNWRKVMPDGGE